MTTVQAVQLTDSGQLASNDTRIPDASLLMVTSALLLHVSIHGGSPKPWVEWIDLFVTALIAFGASLCFRRWRRLRRFGGVSEFGKGTIVTVHSTSNSRQVTPRPNVVEVAFLLGFVTLPFVTDIVMRSVAFHGNPLEIQLTLAIRNLMLGLVILPTSVTCRLAVMTSLFLAIYGAIVSVSAVGYGLLTAYALFGLWWLMGDYWQRLSARFPDESTTEIPYFARVGAVALVLLSLGGGSLAFQVDDVTSAVAGFLPSSGGTGGNDPFARGGVGDGDQMVGATDDADSFGPIESELFLESKQPTLYDMYIDTYEPPTPRKRDGYSRAIPLSSEENQKQNHTNHGQNKKASREFSTIRRESGNRKRRKLEDIESKALLYVAGRTPLHMALAIYDHWDGRELSLREALPEPDLRLEVDDANRNWARPSGPSRGEVFGRPERHQLKIINLKTPTVPSPPNLTALRIDKLHDADFFRWEDGLLRLGGTRIPSLTVIHVESQSLRQAYLDRLVLRRSQVTTSPVESDRLQQLALEWTASATSDWQRVSSICHALRKYTHDSESFVPEETTDAVEYFLFESRRGPDFLFATSAAVLMRSLGFQSRIVSGLYADPQNYDRMAKATGVFATNVHFWTEVKTEDGYWISVEPTPGFELLYARRTFLEAATAAISGGVNLLARQPLISSLVAVAVFGSLVFRRQLFAKCATAWWHLRLNAAPRQQVLHSVLLLQRLTAGRNTAPQTGQTVDQWINSIGTPSGDSIVIKEFRSLVSWACYASSDQPACAQRQVRQICIDSVNLLKGRV